MTTPSETPLAPGPVDAEPDDFGTRLLLAAQEHWREIAFVLFGGLAVIGAVTVWSSSRLERERKAQSALAKPLDELPVYRDDPDRGLEAFEAVAEEFDGSQAAAQARFLAATLLLDSGRAAEAVPRLREVEGQFPPDDPLRPFVRLSLARALESEGSVAEAAALYAEVYDAGLRVGDYTALNAARTLAQEGRTDDARRILQEELAAAEAGFDPSAGLVVKAQLARLEAGADGPAAP